MNRPFALLLSFAATALFASSASAQQNPPGYPTSSPPGYPGAAPAGYPAQSQPPPPTNPALGNSADESKDSGLGLEWVYLNADIGYSYVNMESFSSQTLGLAKTASGGPVFGVGAGIRLIFFTLGVRVRDLDLSDIGTLWELSAEAAFHTRISRIDPYFGVRGGYNFVGSLSSSTASVATGQTPASVSIHGFDVGPMVGLDFYLAKLVSIGVDVEGQFLFLQRPKPALPGGATVASECASNTTCQDLYNQSGNSVGFGFIPSAHLGIHF
jgi:hypothetical protein